MGGHAMGENMTDRLFYPEYWYQQGVSEYLLKHYDQALYLLDIALEQNPDLADAWYWRGFTLIALGDQEEADKSISNAKALNPLIDDPYHRRLGPLADITVNTVPVSRAQDDEEDLPQKIETNIDLSKQPDPTGPDMIITSIDPIVREGSAQLEIRATVENQGYRPTQNFFLTFYLSEDNQVNKNDTPIGYYLIPDMKTGSTKSITGYFPMETMTPGSYYLGAIADQGNEIMEVSESNNIRVSPSMITIPDVRDPSYVVSLNPVPRSVEKSVADSRFSTEQPDPIITRISSPSNVIKGGTLPVNVTVKNQGQADSGPFRISLYLSPDALITESDQVLGYGDIPNLGAGMITEGSAQAKIPEDMEAGSYYIGIFVDSEKAIKELNEVNNIQFSEQKVNVTPQLPPAKETVNLLPDLITRNLSSDLSGNHGGIINVTTSVMNSGGGDASRFIVDLYLSKDTTLSPEDILLGMGEILDLPAGMESEGKASALIPQNITAGTYYFGIMADAEDMVNESNESNNIGFAEIPVIIK